MGLYQAVTLAAKQRYAASADNSRAGSEFYLFAHHGGGLEAGPLDPGRVTRSQGVRELEAGLSHGERRDGHVLVVKQGTVVVQAAPSQFRVAGRFGGPDAGYYVLHDHVAVFGNAIMNPRAGTDSAGAPDVQFGFRGRGAPAFQHLTAAVARRGELLSIGTQQLDQHFAIALDNQLITVPEIDYTVYPDGVTGRQGADITSGFTRSATRGLVTALRLGTLPLELTLVSESAGR
jgi:SecD/SecF fusion protein